MQYMLAVYGDERAAETTPREQMTEIINAYMAYTQALRDAKVLVASNRLKPTSAATTVRTVDGQTKVLDGPFAETKEQLGGYYLIDVPDLDAALSWAKRCPAARYGTVEVRPSGRRGRATASSSLISPRAPATSQWPRMPYPMHSRPPSPAGRPEVSHKPPKLGCWSRRAGGWSTRHGAGALVRPLPTGCCCRSRRRPRG
jgi:hypothetical protein